MGIAILTIQGMEMAYQNEYDKSIFDDIQLPTGIDLTTLVERIFIRCGEFSVMHTDFDYFKWQSDNFFKVHYNTFQKWVDALNIQYNPLENYDRYEQYTGSGQSASQSSAQGSGQSSDTVNDSESVTSSETNTKTVAAFNSSSYENYDKNVLSGSTTKTGSSTGSSTNSSTDSATGSGNYSDLHNIHTHGNIGVTTSQQMLQSEWEVALLNIYTAIADMYSDEFCIKVY